MGVQTNTKMFSLSRDFLFSFLWRTAVMPFFWLLSVSLVLAQGSPASGNPADQEPLVQTDNPASQNEPTSSPGENLSSAVHQENSAPSLPTEPNPSSPAQDNSQAPTETPTPPETPANPETAPPSEAPIITPPETVSTAAAVIQETPGIEAPLPEETVTVVEAAKETVDYSADYQLYKKYLLFQKYEKRELYRKYARYQQLAGMAPWESSRKAEKKLLKKLKKDYKKYAKKPAKYSRLASRAALFANYGAWKGEYFSLKPYAGYAHYAGFNREEFTASKDYGTAEYKAGYERYLAALAAGLVTDKGDADLNASDLGPEITVGIFSYTPKDLKENSLSVSANQSFEIWDRHGQMLATIAADTKIKEI